MPGGAHSRRPGNIGALQYALVLAFQLLGLPGVTGFSLATLAQGCCIAGSTLVAAGSTSWPRSVTPGPAPSLRGRLFHKASTPRARANPLTSFPLSRDDEEFIVKP